MGAGPIDPPSDARLRAGLGVLSVLFYVTHGGYWVLWRGEPENLLWSCHLASSLIGFGLLTRAAWLNAVGVTWLSLGTPLWLVDVFTGGEFLPTSMGTHLGGLAVGLWGARRLGFPAGTWWRSAIGVAILQQICRAFTSARTNVNLSHRVWDGWESTFPTYGEFWLCLFVACGVVYWGAEAGLRRWTGGRDRSADSGALDARGVHESEPGAAGG